MKYLNIIKYPLLPILIPQGLWAKWRTPRLNEAQGERTGYIGHGSKNIRLLILGDSAAAGVGVKSQQEALLGQLCKQFDLTKYTIHWQLHAQSGHTLVNLINVLTHLPTQIFDIVIISSGVNDILQQHSVQKWQRHYLQLYQQLQERFGQPKVLFSQVPPLQHFTALPKILAWYLGQWAICFNQNLSITAKQLPCFYFVATNLPVSTEYLAHDGFHPSALSYTLWAKHLIDYIHTEQLI